MGLQIADSLHYDEIEMATILLLYAEKRVGPGRVHGFSIAMLGNSSLRLRARRKAVMKRLMRVSKIPSRTEVQLEQSNSCSFQLAKTRARTNPHCCW